ncbi:hypothetical protein AK812_SmicGene19760 [Symbiodinium microadriaticum]|uniref:Uncharacterized protein n=1 Tax=Symbiodinium microadriaticum TaxID=2951 RepID=A0A1Q9DRU2_SYMMI|nr:hypothetical protein AK812_SmicGene19760 [Symbiodinium microadriaticum]
MLVLQISYNSRNERIVSLLLPVGPVRASRLSGRSGGGGTQTRVSAKPRRRGKARRADCERGARSDGGGQHSPHGSVRKLLSAPTGSAGEASVSGHTIVAPKKAVPTGMENLFSKGIRIADSGDADSEVVLFLEAGEAAAFWAGNSTSSGPCINASCTATLLLALVISLPTAGALGWWYRNDIYISQAYCPNTEITAASAVKAEMSPRALASAAADASGTSGPLISISGSLLRLNPSAELCLTDSTEVSLAMCQWPRVPSEAVEAQIVGLKLLVQAADPHLPRMVSSFAESVRSSVNDTFGRRSFDVNVREGRRNRFFSCAFDVHEFCNGVQTGLASYVALMRSYPGTTIIDSCASISISIIIIIVITTTIIITIIIIISIRIADIEDVDLHLRGSSLLLALAAQNGQLEEEQKAGQAVTISYGQQSQEQQIFNFGFALDSSSLDLLTPLVGWLSKFVCPALLPRFLFLERGEQADGLGGDLPPVALLRARSLEEIDVSEMRAVANLLDRRSVADHVKSQQVGFERASLEGALAQQSLLALVCGVREKASPLFDDEPCVEGQAYLQLPASLRAKASPAALRRLLVRCFWTHGTRQFCISWLILWTFTELDLKLCRYRRQAATLVASARRMLKAEELAAATGFQQLRPQSSFAVQDLLTASVDMPICIAGYLGALGGTWAVSHSLEKSEEQRPEEEPKVLGG